MRQNSHVVLFILIFVEKTLVGRKNSKLLVSDCCVFFSIHVRAIVLAIPGTCIALALSFTCLHLSLFQMTMYSSFSIRATVLSITGIALVLSFTCLHLSFSIRAIVLAITGIALAFSFTCLHLSLFRITHVFFLSTRAIVLAIAGIALVLFLRFGVVVAPPAPGWMRRWSCSWP